MVPCNIVVERPFSSLSSSQVSGLWIVLAVTIGVAFLGALVARHVNKRKYLARLVASTPSLTRRGSVARAARAAAAAAVLQHENELYAAERAGRDVDALGLDEVPAGSKGSPV